MGYTTNYTGPQIDEALLKGQNIRVVNNGWILLDSGETTPINLQDLKQSGNFTIYHWLDGPTINGVTSIAPINLTIVYLNDTLYQFADLGGYHFSRSYNNETAQYGVWAIRQTNGSINPGPTPPPSPDDGRTLWMDTSNAAKPTLKLYIGGSWTELVPSTAMLKSVYDSNNRATDIFNYIDTKMRSASENFTPQVLREHMEDNTIHITPAERTKWNGMASQDDLSNSIATLRSNLTAAISAAVSGDLSKINQLAADLDNVEAALNTHLANTTIHPDSTKRAEWDAKAAGNHTHNLDGKVTISPSNITGYIPDTMLEYYVKERTYNVESMSELLELRSPVHNGDLVYIEGPATDNFVGALSLGDASDSVLAFDDGESIIAAEWSESYTNDRWYAVIDDTNLGDIEAFLQINTANIEFNNILNLPTTIAGYGITDAATKAELEAYVQKLDQLDAFDSTNLQYVQLLYNRLIASRAMTDLVTAGSGTDVDSGTSPVLKFETQIQKGKSLNLFGNVMPDYLHYYPIIWTTSDSSIAVIAGGNVTGISNGTCVITGFLRDPRFTVEVEITVGNSFLAEFITGNTNSPTTLIDSGSQLPLAFDWTL